jgi:hypothetical protein
MTEQELSKLTDEELLEQAKKMRSTSITNAVFIGIMIGIVIFSIAKNSLGFFTLIPLFIAYKLIDKSKQHKILEKILKERNLI